MKRRLVGVVAAVAISGGLVACGSDNSGSSAGAADKTTAASTSTESSGPLVPAASAAVFKKITGNDALTGPATMAQLKPRVAKYTAAPTALLEKTPVSKKAQPGKKIVYLVCGVPICSEVANAYQKAAQSLGWSLQKVDLGVSPQEFNQAFTRAVQIKPDLVIGSGLNRELISKGLAELAKNNIPTIQWAAGITPKSGEKLYTMIDLDQHDAYGMVASEFLAADDNLKSHTVVYNVPQYATTTQIGKMVEGYLPKICPNCSVDYQEMAVSDIGKLGQKVTAYVQKHPDTTHVLCTNGDFCLGVAQALRAAGQQKVKVATTLTATTNLQNIANETEEAGISLPLTALGWQLVDQSQRIFNGDDLSDTTLMPIQMVTSVGNPGDPTIGAVPDFEKQYQALWNPAG
jgi:ribose transport system substrate-binding protein